MSTVWRNVNRFMSRHDPAIAPRIVLVGEVWWPMVLADHLLRQRAAKLQKNTIEETTKYLADAYQG